MDMDDDLALAGGNASAETNVDPFSRAILQKDDSGKYPIKMPCGHIYNWNTIMSKRQGAWALNICAGLSLASLPPHLQPTHPRQFTRREFSPVGLATIHSF
jgi:hypothetical protein